MYTEDRIKEKIGPESAVDMDWFFIDHEGYIAFVASGGGLIPDSVEVDTHKLVSNYFRSLHDISKEVTIDKKILQEASAMEEHQKNLFLEDLYSITRKGLYYFDKLQYNNYLDFKYYRKASPITPITLNNISKEIAEILSKTFVEGKIPEMLFFNVNDIS